MFTLVKQALESLSAALGGLDTASTEELRDALGLAKAPRTKAELLEMAKSLPTDEFAQAAQRWTIQRQSAADLEAQHRRNRRNRSVRFRTGEDGSVDAGTVVLRELSHGGSVAGVRQDGDDGGSVAAGSVGLPAVVGGELDFVVGLAHQCLGVDDVEQLGPAVEFIGRIGEGEVNPVGVGVQEAGCVGSNHCRLIGDTERDQVGGDGSAGGGVRVHKCRMRGAARQGLDAERARAGEQVQHGGATGQAQAEEHVEDGFASTVRRRPNPVARRRFEATPAQHPAHDAHSATVRPCDSVRATVQRRPLMHDARSAAVRPRDTAEVAESISVGVHVPAEIVCVDCGGRCGLLSYQEPDWGFQPGDVVAYRCADCGDRWDLIVEDAESPG